MPGRLGPRFAIEALFLIALAVGVAYADLASKWIVLVMAGGWLVVASLELAADRIWAAAPPWRRPYYVPASPPRAEPVGAAPPPAAVEAEPEAEAEPKPEPQPEPQPEPAVAEKEPEPEPNRSRKRKPSPSSLRGWSRPRYLSLNPSRRRSPSQSPWPQSPLDQS